jgi:hypothetical protein
MRGHHSHFVSALGEDTRQTFGIDRETRRMWSVIGKNSKYLHKAERLYPHGYDFSDTFLEPDALEQFKAEHLAEVEKLATKNGIWLDIASIFAIGHKTK